MPRDYKRERKLASTPKELKRNAARKAARRKLEKAGKVKKGDGKDVAHRNGNPLDNKGSNLKVSSKKANRSFPRTKTAKKKNPRD